MMRRMARKGFEIKAKDGLRPELLSLVRRLYPYSLLASSIWGADSEWIGGKKGADADECHRVAADDTHQRRRPFSRRSAPH
jgi:hypothetical protein